MITTKPFGEDGEVWVTVHEDTVNPQKSTVVLEWTHLGEVGLGRASIFGKAVLDAVAYAGREERRMFGNS